MAIVVERGVKGVKVGVNQYAVSIIISHWTCYVVERSWRRKNKAGLSHLKMEEVKVASGLNGAREER